MPLNLEMVKMVSILCILPQFKKTRPVNTPCGRDFSPCRAEQSQVIHVREGARWSCTCLTPVWVFRTHP